MKTLSISHASTLLLAAAVFLLPGVTMAEEGVSTPIGLSDSETSYKGARVLRYNVELFGGDAVPGYYADEEGDMVTRYSYWQGDTLFFGAVNQETQNTIDGVAEFYWFESSVPKSSDFYVMVVKVKSSPNAVDDWQLTQEDGWLGELMYDIDPCQRLNVKMAEQGSAGSIRWDWSVPFQNYQWEPVKTIEIEEGYSAGFNATAEANRAANAKAEFKEGGFLADASANKKIQTKGYFNADYSVKSKYTVTLYKWQMLVQGGATNMTWNMVVTEDGTITNDSAYHEYFIVVQAPQGETAHIAEINIGAGFRRPAWWIWPDSENQISVSVQDVTFTPPLEIECYSDDDVPADFECPARLVLAGSTRIAHRSWRLTRQVHEAHT